MYTVKSQYMLFYFMLEYFLNFIYTSNIYKSNVTYNMFYYFYVHS